MSEHPSATSSDPSQTTDGSSTRPSRHGFLQNTAATVLVLTLPYESADACTDTSAPARPVALTPARPVSLNINGKPYALSLEPRITLLDALREVLGLTGTEKGCGRGQYGVCTVLVNGWCVNSCLTLTIMHESEAITAVGGLAHTYEGVVDRTALYPMQATFLEHDAPQCGCYAPGQICSAITMLKEAGHSMPSVVTSPTAPGNDGAVTLTEDEIRERMNGNLCRYDAYPNIVAAIRVVAAESGNVV